MSAISTESVVTTKPKQRLFGPAENGLINTSLQHQGYMRVGEVLHLQGPHITLALLESAVSCLQRRHPFLRSRLQINPGKAGGYLMEEDSTLRLPIRELSRKREDHLNFWSEEWRRREKEPVMIGQPLVQFWLLQDPDDVASEDGPREILIICDHSICDGVSLSTVAHELLIALSDNNDSMFDNSLNWPKTIEETVQGNQSKWNAFVATTRLILTALFWRASSGRFIARIPTENIDFPLNDMAKHCHTESFHGSLNKSETAKLIEKCHREGVTVTSAISSANLCTVATLIDNSTAKLVYAFAADIRRRCLPPVPNHDLSYQASGILAFSMPANETPTTSTGMWQLAKMIQSHLKTAIDAGQILATGKFMGKIFEKNLKSIDLAETPTCICTNWGCLPFVEHYGKWKLLAMKEMGNAIRLPMPVLIAHTVNGVLTTGFAGAVPFLSSSSLEKLRDGTMQNLRQMIAD